MENKHDINITDYEDVKNITRILKIYLKKVKKSRQDR